jgi:hypothetical protein
MHPHLLWTIWRLIHASVNLPSAKAMPLLDTIRPMSALPARAAAQARAWNGVFWSEAVVREAQQQSPT